MRLASTLALLFCFVIALPGPAEEKPALQPQADTPLPLKPVRAFPNLRPRRPIIFTHPGDGTNRVFICSQQGVVHMIDNDQDVAKTKTFLDIESRVVYKDKQNEEGLLGMVFHPKYSENGEFFIYYTTTDAPHTSVVSRFRVSEDDPNKADPSFEEELLRIPQPFWNHNGGTLEFGPDGMLYIALGDGGKANDPFNNAQNLETWLGSILRIDVDNKSNGKNYAIPADNPFVDKEGAQPEIYAYGLRNVWRMTFDSKTGTGWIADVGQNLWEEINLLEKGGNYGWNLREAMHRFTVEGREGAPARDDLIEPIWEYHHEIGKSITGGIVYRGKKFPELDGCYLYADYVSGKLWALKYDLEQKKVVANYALQDNKMPIITFGTDEQGEVYFCDSFGQIWTLTQAD